MVMLFNVTTVLLPGVTRLTEKVTLVPAGTPAVATRLIGVETEYAGCLRGDGGWRCRWATACTGIQEKNSKVGLFATIVKFTSDIS